MPFVSYSMPPDTFHPFSFTPSPYTQRRFSLCGQFFPTPVARLLLHEPYLPRFLQPLWLFCVASEKTRLPSATSYTFFVWACPPYRRSGFSFQCLAICSCVARHFHCNPSRAYLNVSKLSSTIV